MASSHLWTRGSHRHDCSELDSPAIEFPIRHNITDLHSQGYLVYLVKCLRDQDLIQREAKSVEGTRMQDSGTRHFLRYLEAGKPKETVGRLEKNMAVEKIEGEKEKKMKMLRKRMYKSFNEDDIEKISKMLVSH